MQTLPLAASAALALAGDWLIGHASLRDAWPLSLIFVVGMALCGLPASCWFCLMRGHSLAAVGVFYSAATILGAAVVGPLAFGEVLAPRHALGIALALASVAAMAGR